jgi:hypothetical protein
LYLAQCQEQHCRTKKVITGKLEKIYTVNIKSLSDSKPFKVAQSHF